MGILAQAPESIPKVFCVAREPNRAFGVGQGRAGWGGAGQGPLQAGCCSLVNMSRCQAVDPLHTQHLARRKSELPLVEPPAKLEPQGQH